MSKEAVLAPAFSPVPKTEYQPPAADRLAIDRQGSPGAYEALRKQLTAESRLTALKKQVESVLPDIPIERNVDQDVKSVAGHELGHALVAYHKGVGIESISVVPDGNVLGVTRLSGSADLQKFKVIAAAGSIDTAEGKAEGYGSDIFKARLITHYHGGQAVESARSEAHGIINSYPKEIRSKVAEMITLKRNVPGSMLPAMIRRAQLEIALEKFMSGADRDEFREAAHIPEREPVAHAYDVHEERDENRAGGLVITTRKYKDEQDEEQIADDVIIIEDENNNPDNHQHKDGDAFAYREVIKKPEDKYAPYNPFKQNLRTRTNAWNQKILVPVVVSEQADVGSNN